MNALLSDVALFIVLTVSCLLSGTILNALLKFLRFRMIVLVLLNFTVIAMLTFHEDSMVYAFLATFVLSIWTLYKSIHSFIFLRGIAYAEECKDSAWTAVFSIYVLFIGYLREVPHQFLLTRFHMEAHTATITLLVGVCFTALAIYYFNKPIISYKKLKRHLSNHGWVLEGRLESVHIVRNVRRQKEIGRYFLHVLNRMAVRKKMINVPYGNQKLFILLKKDNQLQSLILKGFERHQLDTSCIKEMAEQTGMPEELVHAYVLESRHGSGSAEAAREAAAAVIHSILREQQVEAEAAIPSGQEDRQTESHNLGMLRITWEDHPLLKEAYELRRSYMLLLVYALEDLKKKHAIVEPLLDTYAAMLGLDEADWSQLKQQKLQENKAALIVAFSVMRRLYIKRITWFRYRINQYNLAIYAHVIYISGLLEGSSASVSLFQLLGQSLRIKPEKQEQMSTYCNSLLAGDWKLAQLQLMSGFTNREASQLEFLSRWAVQVKPTDVKKVFRAAVVATMSAGKSTLMNALAGYNLFPSKNQACTAKISAMHNNDELKKVIGFSSDVQGRLAYHGDVEQAVLMQWNEDQSVFVHLEGSLSGIRNQSQALVLYDTPGTNYSQDPTHNRITYQFLNESELNLILYVMNATQIATEDDQILLNKVIEALNGKANGQILFLLNKVDEFDLAGDDDLNTSISNLTQYITAAGVEKPLILPISTYGAKLFRMALGGLGMSKKEASDFKYMYRFFIEDQVDLNRYTTGQQTESSTLAEREDDRELRVGDREYRAAEVWKALNRTGIPLLEKRLESMLTL